MLESRPSKKQQELFLYIKAFIAQQGYGPSYREIMRALDYKSVSTVAVHVDGLIARGLLRKKDHSARSLEVGSENGGRSTGDHLGWLEHEIRKRYKRASSQDAKDVPVLLSAYSMLGGSEAYEALKKILDEGVVKETI